jgi:hypothetical protein
MTRTAHASINSRAYAPVRHRKIGLSHLIHVHHIDLVSLHVTNTLNDPDANDYCNCRLLAAPDTQSRGDKNSDSTEYSLYRYNTLNMKLGHTQAGRLASTRGDYHTAH